MNDWMFRTDSNQRISDNRRTVNRDLIKRVTDNRVSSAPSQLLETEQFAKWDAEGAEASHPIKLLVFLNCLVARPCRFRVSGIDHPSAGTIVFSHKRHPSTDRGASPGLRFDGDLAADQVQSLSHADEPQAVTVAGVLCLQSLLGRRSRHCYGIISPTENCRVEGD